MPIGISTTEGRIFAERAGRGGSPFLRLLRLVSPALPVGGFSYSRGLEAAVEQRWVKDESSALNWITGVLEHVFTVLDGALFCRMMAALSAGELQDFLQYDAWLRASRESRELELEDRRMGAALQRLRCDLGAPTGTELLG